MMFEQTFKNIDDILRKDAGCGSELDYVEQTRDRPVELRPEPSVSGKSALIRHSPQRIGESVLLDNNYVNKKSVSRREESFQGAC